MTSKVFFDEVPAIFCAPLPSCLRSASASASSLEAAAEADAEREGKRPWVGEELGERGTFLPPSPRIGGAFFLSSGDVKLSFQNWRGGREKQQRQGVGEGEGETQKKEKVFALLLLLFGWGAPKTPPPPPAHKRESQGRSAPVHPMLFALLFPLLKGREGGRGEWKQSHATPADLPLPPPQKKGKRNGGK